MIDAEKRVPLVFFRTDTGSEPVREWLLKLAKADRRIARVIVCIHDEELFALHGFIKKTQKTPDGDLKLARTRRRQLEKTR